MGQPLANVLDELHGPRGADVVHRITVPHSWLGRGGCLEIVLPRNVACATCEGGGCDACGRAGAVSLRGRRDPPEILTVPVPASGEVDSDVCLRIGARGGTAEDPALPRGNMLLILRWAEEPSQGVTLAAPSSSARVADPQLIGRVAGMAAALCILFYLMLRLSGWL